MSPWKDEAFRIAVAFSAGWLLTSVVFLWLGGGQIAWAMAVSTPVGFAMTWWLGANKKGRSRPG